MSRVGPGVSRTRMVPIAAVRSGRPWIMFRWRRGKSVPTEAAPAASEQRPAGRGSVAAPTAPPQPVVSTATGELAAIAARLHGGPVRPAHVPAHKALPEDPPVDAAAGGAPDADREPDLRPLALIVQAALAHHFGPEGAWALVRRTPDTTAGFFDELMTAHIARDVALALGASPAAAGLPLEDAWATGSSEPDASPRDAAARQDAVARELAVFDEDPLDGALAELAGDPRRVPAVLRAVRSA
ncbi:hypothetical protein LIX22_001032 [Clavibacter nebraskensis]|nr:hypothetical protein FGQ65_04590 [Clavibacter nebraskensis]UQB14432.1 hypothetical protein LIX20_001033 [Clavibacter nebraskensis]UQB17264.1 hypothetical protein LIX22_001032 [Clavibacter nebraskensis]